MPAPHPVTFKLEDLKSKPIQLNTCHIWKVICSRVHSQFSAVLPVPEVWTQLMKVWFIPGLWHLWWMWACWITVHHSAAALCKLPWWRELPCISGWEGPFRNFGPLLSGCLEKNPWNQTKHLDPVLFVSFSLMVKSCCHHWDRICFHSDQE
jgi:hypothetical protein